MTANSNTSVASNSTLIQTTDPWQSALEKTKAFAPWEDPDGQSDDEDEEFKPLVLKGGEEDSDESAAGDEGGEHSFSNNSHGSASSVASTLQRTLVFGCAGGFVLGCLVAALAMVSLASFNDKNASTIQAMPQTNGSLEPSATNTPLNSSSLPSFNNNTNTVDLTGAKDNANDQSQAPKDETLSMTETKPETTAEKTHEVTTEEKTNPVSDNAPTLVLGTTQETFQTSTQKLSKNMEVLTPEHQQAAQSTNLCNAVHEMEHRTKPNAVLLYNITATSCMKMYGGMGGTGNIILEMVGQRLAAFAEGKTSLIWDCGEDAFDTRRKLVCPWISGYFPIMDTKQPPMDMALPTMLCQRPGRARRMKADNNKIIIRNLRQDRDLKLGNNIEYDERLLNAANKLPLKFMNPLISHDLRRMAVAMVGVPHKDHPSAEFEQKYLLSEAKLPPYTPSPATGAVFKVQIHDYYENGPLFPDVTLDDVVIHFRCGDVLMGAYGPFYYPRYEEYTKLISPEARTIGIVTQPFAIEEGVQARGRDNIQTSGERCRVLVEGLVNFMQERFPKAKFSIHNGPDETITLAYARLIMANQTFGLIPSTFSTFPVLASFGTGYVTKPPPRGGSFAGIFLNDERAEGLYENQPVEVDIYANMIYCQDLKRMWDEGKDKIIEWFRTITSPEG